MSDEDSKLEHFSGERESERISGDNGLKEEGFLTLPYDWGIATVDDVATENGLVDGDWIESDDMDENGDIQLVQLAHIGEGRFKGEPDRFITKEFAEQENCTILSEGDLLISRMQEPILRSCLLPSFDRDSVMAVDIARLTHTEDWNRHFLKYLFNYRSIWKQGIAWASGTTRKRISRTNLEKLRLPAPPLEEQRKTASVLYTIDQAILKTGQIIDEISRIQTGVKRHLFSEGYYQHSTLEETYFGPNSVDLPEDWDVMQIGQISETVESGLTPRGGSKVYQDSGVPFIRSQNVLMNELDFEDIAYISQEKHHEMTRSAVKSGDVLLNITGASIGRVVSVPKEVREANVNQHVCRIRLSDETKTLPKFLSYFLSTHWGQKQVTSFQGGSTREGLNYDQVRSIKLPLPPIDEQEKIVKVQSSISKKRKQEENFRNSLARLKSGLMQDLLTGEVRTHDKDIEVLDEVLQFD